MHVQQNLDNLDVGGLIGTADTYRSFDAHSDLPRYTRWLKYRSRIDPKRLVFIDETWTKTNMAPLRGWAPRGTRLKAKVPHRRWKTMTFLAALRHDRIDAPWFLDGPINGQSFRTYVEKVLAPTLEPGDIVMIDNLGSHRAKPIRRAIRSTGAKLFFLPKYSPDLNPIEQVFAKLKHLLRKAAARSPEAVCACIGQFLNAYPPCEAANIAHPTTPRYDFRCYRRSMTTTCQRPE